MRKKLSFFLKKNEEEKGPQQMQGDLMAEEGAPGPPRQRSLSADWIIDESWWGEGAQFAADRSDAGTQLNVGSPFIAAESAQAGPAAAERPVAIPPAPPRKHREMRVYLGASTWVPRPGFALC